MTLLCRMQMSREEEEDDEDEADTGGKKAGGMKSITKNKPR